MRRLWKGMGINMQIRELSQFFPERLRASWNRYSIEWEQLMEIRIRVNRSVILNLQGKELVTDVIYTERELEDIFRHLCHDSVYAYEQQRCMGYLTLPGGHRVGITGELSHVEPNRYLAKYIRYMNIRIAHEKKGIAESIIEYMKNEKEPYNMLLISPPGIGKTTLLRDIVRILSGYGYTTGVIDERGEVAGAFQGNACLDCGLRTDVITGGEKTIGVQILVRSFSPRIIAIDEIGTQADAEAIFYAGVSGCKIVATAHGSSISDIFQKKELGTLMKQKIFERILVLSKDEQGRRLIEIRNQDGDVLCGRRLLQEF